MRSFRFPRRLSLARLTIVPVVLVSGAAALCGNAILEGRRIQSRLQRESERREALMAQEQNLLKFELEERATVESILKLWDLKIPASANAPEVYEEVSRAAQSTGVDLLVCDVNEWKQDRRIRSPRGALLPALRVDVTIHAEAALISPFLREIQSAERLMIVDRVEIVRDEDSFPKTVCRMTARTHYRGEVSEDN